MTAEEYAALYDLLRSALADKDPSYTDVDWYVLGAAQRVAFARRIAAQYPEPVVADPAAWQAVARSIR